MQTLSQIQSLLQRIDAQPNRRFGQCFLIDRRLMDKVVETAELRGDETVLEVGPGTGSLTEELLPRTRRVVAVEIDRRLAGLMRRRFAEAENFSLIEADVLARKSCINPEVLSAITPRAVLVANLPYNIATPLIADCMIESWRSLREAGVRFDRLTFTVQQEVALRMAATGGSDYGIVSVLLGVLGKVTLGPAVPAQAFWPQPKVASRIVRVDFDQSAAEALADINILQAVLSMVFTQRRKRLASTARARGAPFEPDIFTEAMRKVDIDPAARAQEIPPTGYRDLANHLHTQE